MEELLQLGQPRVSAAPWGLGLVPSLCSARAPHQRRFPALFNALRRGGAGLGRVGCVSFPPLTSAPASPSGTRVSAALPARISVSSPCQCHPAPAASTGALLPARRCAEMAAQPLEEMADSFVLALSAFPPPFLSSLLPAFAGAYAAVWGRQPAPVLRMALSRTLPSAHSSSQITTGCQRNYGFGARAAAGWQGSGSAKARDCMETA